MDIRVDIAQAPMQDTVDIYVHSNDGRRNFAAEMVTMTMRTFEDGEPIQPFLRITRHDRMAENFLRALAKALVDAGYIPGDPAAAAALKATEFHLSDMRKLLKLEAR